MLSTRCFYMEALWMCMTSFGGWWTVNGDFGTLTNYLEKQWTRPLDGGLTP